MKNLHKRPIAFLEDRLAGGIGRVIVNLSNAMVRLGMPVDILLKTTTGPYLEQLHPQVRITKFSTFNRISGIPGVLRYLWRRRPLALITPSERLTAIALAARRFVFNPPKVLVCIHNIDQHWLEETISQTYRKRLRRIQHYYPKCDRVICVSDALRARFLKETGISAENVCTIYNPVVTDELHGLAGDALEHPWFQKDASPVILGAGRLEPQKDFTTLIKAFAEVRQHLDCRLVILGEGSRRSELEQMIRTLEMQDQVDLPGEVKNPYKYMHKAALFVLSSMHEGLGIVLIEALALGTPVVSTDCPYGPSEILEEGRYGPLTPVGDIQALATAMEETLRNPPPSEFLQTATQRFTAETTTQQYFELIGV